MSTDLSLGPSSNIHFLAAPGSFFSAKPFFKKAFLIEKIEDIGGLKDYPRFLSLSMNKTTSLIFSSSCNYDNCAYMGLIYGNRRLGNYFTFKNYTSHPFSHSQFWWLFIRHDLPDSQLKLVKVDRNDSSQKFLASFAYHCIEMLSK